MNRTKEIWMSGFALFSMFFGAGNLILPPLLGFKALDQWFIVAAGFAITAVIIPITAIYAHARLQGTLYDFGKKVSPDFSVVYCVLIYIIAIALPAPRTASVTHEMAIQPFFETPTLLTSTIYFALVLVFVLNRSKVLSILGKFLTPLIVIILLLIIGIGMTSDVPSIASGISEAPLVNGILEGYQTFDAIGGVVVGAVLIISLNLRGHNTFQDKKELIIKSGLIAGGGLFIIYAGLIFVGALYGSSFSADIDRTALLSGLSLQTLGSIGTTFLSVLVALACFTTAVGIITGTADYFKGLFKESQLAYIITAVLGSVIGVIVGSYNVGFIIDIALPALMFIYPITIVLIILNVCPERWTSGLVFKAVVITTFVFSIPDFLKFFMNAEKLQPIIEAVPMAEHSLGWVLPALVVFVLVNVLQKSRPHSDS
ncbi:branched-chain amino acid transport system II carrier protein [Winogradskyella sp. PC-19]|uniref:branched-chain amino acid transport system II carrier protein n=1 Tax=unclassified Winogradskyella TaxID=2615021 RepID=UPI000B3C285E|nr:MULTISPECIES: branched-chain amino acid transport system II carrier protein [unclassified Winogradskyella]ARV09839.1 branched-chain amino acid transport system II carrier protein [Winogradskyella sp. PC-19]RZN83285.1 MAG: branched-chain amino acid transport system II carrier protein [Winogradskyella sp.]